VYRSCEYGFYLIFNSYSHIGMQYIKKHFKPLRSLERVGKLHVSAASPPRKDPSYASDRRLGGPPHNLEEVVTDRNGLPLGNRTPVVQPVTDLSRILPATQ
jgi:hypothetical protein